MTIALGRLHYLILDRIIWPSTGIGFLLILFMYWRCCPKINEHLKVRERLKETECRKMVRVTYNVNSTLTVLWIVISIIIFYIPFVCIKLALTMLSFNRHTSTKLAIILQWFRLLGFMYTIADVVILLCRDKGMRKTLTNFRFLRPGDNIEMQ